MKLFKLNISLFTILLGLITGSCTGSNSPSTSSTKAVESPSSAQSTSSNHEPVSQGGQVVETGDYHLELVTLKEHAGTHLDFYLQNGSNHEPITTALVSGQIQLPNGAEKKLDFNYDQEGKHYTALLPEKEIGEYQVKINAEVDGKSVSGRFSFKQ